VSKRAPRAQAARRYPRAGSLPGVSVVLVTGGTGALGRLVAARLVSRGEEVRILSRRPGAGTHTGDLTTRAGVAEAVSGAEIIVHAASDTQRLGRSDVTQIEHVMEHAGGAAHLLYVSIVGIDRIPFGYYRRKLACEQRVVSSRIPYTILRATQFHELIAFVLLQVERLPVAPLPLEFRFQTIAADEVADRICQLAAEGPTNRLWNLGGPQVQSLRDMVAQWRAVRSRPRRPLPLSLPGAVPRAFREGRNTCPGQAGGRLTWSEYLAQGPTPAYTLGGAGRD
jgi:uncharacterized protein YbjT (DUF2867 family)